MRETTSEICSESERDSLIASPSSFISCLSCGSTGPPCLRSHYHHLASSANGANFEIFGRHLRRSVCRRIVFSPQRFQLRRQLFLPCLVPPRERHLRRAEIAAEKIHHSFRRIRINKLSVPARAAEMLRAGPQPLPHDALLTP